MSKKTKVARNRSLSGIRVLVGRARHQAGALSSELRKRGAEVIEIPFIEIRKARSFQPLDAALKNLRSYDWLILTSVNGVEAMWERLEKLGLVGNSSGARVLKSATTREGHDLGRAVRLSNSVSPLAAEGPLLHIAAIGPATKKAIEQRGAKVDVVPKEYVAESVVRSLKNKVKGRRVLLVRAKVARDVIPLELRKAGASVDVVEAYETAVPHSSRTLLRRALGNPQRRPHVVTFTSSSTVRNFVALLESRTAIALDLQPGRKATRAHTKPILSILDGIRLASIGPVTSSTLREVGLRVDVQAKEFTIPGLVKAISHASV
jgi:uroporphyrinogen-III synthase